ncbi:MAG: radical SAM-associated putative lipoprotein, partial [Muribaculaceae bacterium]|nr:radical SAM-associated putative lipoprotein [Muribaculaceae bacterium]
MDIRSKISGVISQLCTVLLALLGYNCSSSPFNEYEAMYGTPYSTFELKGTVKNEEGKPVDDAIIKAMEPWDISNWERVSKTVTDRSGSYFLSESYFGFDSLKIVCIPVGNAYLSDSITVAMNFKYDDEHKHTEWYLGHATLTV